MTVRPFQFTGLPQLSREQIALNDSLARYLSDRPFRRDFRAQIAGVIQSTIKTEVAIASGPWRMLTRAEVRRMLPEPGCMALLSLYPERPPLIVDLDLGLANAATDMLLGGDGNRTKAHRALSDIERGVFSYLLLQVLTVFESGLQMGTEGGLSLQRLLDHPRDVEQELDQHSSFALLPFRVSLGRRVGMIRVFVAASLIDQSFSRQLTENPDEAELEYMRTQLGRLGARETPLRVEAASLDLKRDEIRALEPGDIVLLEKHELSMTPAGATGNARVRLGLAQNTRIRGRVFAESGTYKIEISEIHTQEAPTEAPMSGPEEEEFLEEASYENFGEENAAHGHGESPATPPPPPPEDNLAQGHGVLRDVDAPVAVELGRIKMNTEQVIRLRPGQVLRLPRGPNDPVDLVVHDRVFARGELVEVDGELGVRLSQILES